MATLTPRSTYKLKELSNGDAFALIGDMKRKVYRVHNKGSFQIKTRRWTGYKWEDKDMNADLNVKYLHSNP